MNASAEYLNPAEAARRLGVSAKALRLYEQRGLVAPVRTAAGWRAYGPLEMARAREVVVLRVLGLSLAQAARVLSGDPSDLEPALAAHQAALESQARDLASVIEKVREVRTRLAQGHAPDTTDLTRLIADEPTVAFDLPWPWGGERFELRDIRPLNYIIGPLGSGKTRLAMALAQALPGAVFLGLERSRDTARLEGDPDLKARIERDLAWLVGDGAVVSDALMALLVGLEAGGAVVVDMVEQGLDEATQQAVIAHLRRRGPGARPLFLMTRSSAILDLAAVGPDEAVILCPANHAPPSRVAAYPGAPGYEAVATCLATPEVRARTEGLVARRADAA